MDQGYYDAAIPDPFTVLGVRLRPLSLGHILILRKIGSAFFDPEEKISIGELATAVAICSRTYEDGLEFLDDPRAVIDMQNWAETLTNQTGLKRYIKWFYKPLDIAECTRFFSDYLKLGLSAPNYTYDKEKTTEINVPNEQLVKVILMSKMNLTEEEIMNRPWSLCIWDMLTLRAIEGQIKFFDSEEYDDAKAEANKLLAKIRGQQHGQ